MKRHILALIFLSLISAPVHAQTQQDLAVILSACQFFAGSELTQQEQAAIAQETQNDFATNPAQAQQEVQSLRALGNQLSQAQDPFKLVESRQAGLFEMYKQVASGQATASTQIVVTKAAPLAVAPDSGVLLLQQDLISTVDYLDMLKQGNGGAPMSRAERQQLVAQIVNGFPNLPDETKAFIIAGPLLVRVLQQRMQQMSIAQQNQLRQQLAQQNTAQMSANQHQTLSTMSRNQHLTTMNILGNMGEGGGYWEVVDKPYW